MRRALAISPIARRSLVDRDGALRSRSGGRASQFCLTGPRAARHRARALSSSSYAGYILETLLTLVVVCGVAFGVLYGARKLGVGRATGPMRLLGQLPLDARRAIYLVGVGDQVFVVAAGEGGFTKLGEMARADLPAAIDETPAFAKALAAAFGKRAARPVKDEEQT